MPFSILHFPPNSRTSCFNLAPSLPFPATPSGAKSAFRAVNSRLKNSSRIIIIRRCQRRNVRLYSGINSAEVIAVKARQCLPPRKKMSSPSLVWLKWTWVCQVLNGKVKVGFRIFFNRENRLEFLGDTVGFEVRNVLHIFARGLHNLNWQVIYVYFRLIKISIIGESVTSSSEEINSDKLRDLRPTLP